jgi:hypothetical protein
MTKSISFELKTISVCGSARVPSDDFEVRIFKDLIERCCNERWAGKAVYQNRNIIGTIRGFKIANPPDESSLVSGWFEGFISIDWPENSHLFEKFIDVLPIKIIVAEREYPASEAYRYEIYYKVEPYPVCPGGGEGDITYLPGGIVKAEPWYRNLHKKVV